MEGKEDSFALRDTAGSGHEDNPESKYLGPLLVCNGGEKLHQATEEEVPVTERIRVSTSKTLKYIRGNKRNLAAMVVLWMAFLATTMAVSIVAPFFPQEVTISPASS